MVELKPAMLFVDLLEDFLQKREFVDSRGRLAAAVNELAKAARELSIPIIWVRQEFEEDLSDAFQSMRDNNIRITIKGTPGCRLVSELDQHPTDHEIVKKRYSCFYNTRLEELLTKLGCNTLVIGGVNTHACVRMAAVDAYQRDFRVVLARDCIGSYDKQYHDESMRYLEQSIGKAVTNSELIAELRSA